MQAAYPAFAVVCHVSHVAQVARDLQAILVSLDTMYEQSEVIKSVARAREFSAQTRIALAIVYCYSTAAENTHAKPCLFTTAHPTPCARQAAGS